MFLSIFNTGCAAPFIIYWGLGEREVALEYGNISGLIVVCFRGQRLSIQIAE